MIINTLIIIFWLLVIKEQKAKLQKYLKNTGGSPLIYFNPTKGFIKTGMFVQNSILESDLNVEQR